jgi:parallel beta-helix repeat protein
VNSLAQTALAAAGAAGNVFFVDDDGAQCPGALTTIQEAVSQAGEGAIILVCPGLYTRQVNISGPEKTGLKLISLGRDDEVIIQGDHTQPYGILLENVTNVLVRGFTIRDFGNKPTTANQFGWGCAIHLTKANYNIIEHNRVSKTDMVGINLDNSAYNIIRYNLITEIDPKGFGVGIALWGGKGTSGNFVFANRAAQSPAAGIVVWSAGVGNSIVDNNFSNNGQWGISHRDTEGTIIEGNRFSHNTEAWGVISMEKDNRAIGVELRKSNNVTVVGNMAHNNTQLDISWDKLGAVTFERNGCAKADQPGLCGQ